MTAATAPAASPSHWRGSSVPLALGILAAGIHVALGRELESVIALSLFTCVVSLASLWLSLAGGTAHSDTDVVVGLLERHAAVMQEQVARCAAVRHG